MIITISQWDNHLILLDQVRSFFLVPVPSQASRQQWSVADT